MDDFRTCNHAVELLTFALYWNFVTTSEDQDQPDLGEALQGLSVEAQCCWDWCQIHAIPLCEMVRPYQHLIYFVPEKKSMGWFSGAFDAPIDYICKQNQILFDKLYQKTLVAWGTRLLQEEGISADMQKQIRHVRDQVQCLRWETQDLQMLFHRATNPLRYYTYVCMTYLANKRHATRATRSTWIHFCDALKLGTSTDEVRHLLFQFLWEDYFERHGSP